MAKKEKGNHIDFLSHKVKDYASYRKFMAPNNSGRDMKSIKFHPASLSHNQVL